MTEVKDVPVREAMAKMQLQIDNLNHTLGRVVDVVKSANSRIANDEDRMRDVLHEIANELNVDLTRKVAIEVTLLVENDNEASVSNQIIDISGSGVSTSEFSFDDIVDVSAFVTNEDIEDVLSREDSWESGNWGSTIIEVRSVSVEDA